MPHPRRCLGVQAIRIVVFVAAIACSAGAAPGQRPNVLFLVVDDLRPELGCYGNPIVKSPNIDRLAQRGVAFTRAYCQQAVCSPSRTSVMTGARPDTTRVWDLVTHFRAAMPDVVTVGQLFRQNGYFVQGTGKIYHGGYDDAPTWSTPWLTPKAPPYALTENLALHERQYATDPNGEKSGRKARRKAAATGDQAADAAAGAPASRRNSRGPAFEGADVPDDTFQDGKVADFAIDRLRAFQKQEQPFFLAVGFVKPHLPFVSPKKYWDLYDPASIPLATNRFRPRGAPDYAILPGSEMRSYHGIPEGSIPDDLARQLKHGYYAAISYTDAQIGRVLDELDRLGIADNTIVVLWGDHGWKLGEHDAWCKHSNTENDTNAPLIIAAPRTRGVGRPSRSLVEFVDIYPTLADLAGLPIPAHVEGVSLRPLLDNPDRPWKSAAFSQYPRNQREGRIMGYSMRTEQHRLTVWVDRDAPEQIKSIEFYDHAKDPQENDNLAGQPELRELQEKLLAAWRRGWKGALPDQRQS
jgi:arylsulfatase A-like enzyme